MKTLIFSDTHLSDRFEEGKFVFLKGLIERADRVIINGDFWDGHLVSFDTFLKSPWSGLFPLLKAKQTVYVYGNHDRKEFCDGRETLFSVSQCARFELVDHGTAYVFEHGNHVLPSIDERLPLPEPVFTLSTRVYTAIEKFITQRTKKTTRFWGKFINDSLKKRNRNSHFAVFGHTHFAEFDAPRKFAVTGFIQHGLAQYLLIENGVISPHEENY
jgi:predicted phosphodiesterase